MRERQPLLKQVDPWVFYPAAGLCLAFVLWGVLDNTSLGSATDSALGWVIRNFGWVFVLVTAAFVVFPWAPLRRLVSRRQTNGAAWPGSCHRWWSARRCG